MVRRRMRNPNAPTKAEIRRKHEKLCALGKHVWRPSMQSKHIGGIPKWDGKTVYCNYCHEIGLFNKLSGKAKKWVIEVEKHLKEAYEKVAVLHPQRSFNKDGY